MCLLYFFLSFYVFVYLPNSLCCACLSTFLLTILSAHLLSYLSHLHSWPFFLPIYSQVSFSYSIHPLFFLPWSLSPLLLSCLYHVSLPITPNFYTPSFTHTRCPFPHTTSYIICHTPVSYPNSYIFSHHVFSHPLCYILSTSPNLSFVKVTFTPCH